MFGFQPSIRQKIIFGYYIILLLIVGVSLFTSLELRLIEKRVMSGEAISEFLDTVLEIRRFEKNYFLYHSVDDYQESIRYVNKARDLFEKNIETFKLLMNAEQLVQLQARLKQYNNLMLDITPAYSNQDRQTYTALEESIRNTGKDLVTYADAIEKIERKDIQELLLYLQKIIVISIIALILVGIIIGRVLTKKITKPLKSLESTMKAITDEKFQSIAINSKDREIISLSKAFNKMLTELDLRQKHLIQSEKLASLGTLLSGVAHELNNPLSNISSSCQILMEELKEAQQSRTKGKEEPVPGRLPPDHNFMLEMLSQIDEQTDRARNIVRSLLEFSREREFKKEDLPLKKLFEETISFIKGQIPTKVSVVTDIPDDITITADKQRLQQAFLNLIKNAVEAISEEGSVFITARKIIAEKTLDIEPVFLECQNLIPKNSRGDAVYISIKDTGRGIEPDILQKIFDPFFTTKDVGKGSGLGLFIVHEIIEEHDGCIAVDSEIGKGTTFLIRLPIKE